VLPRPQERHPGYVSLADVLPEPVFFFYAPFFMMS
jgi:hypothetical protein